MFNSVHIQQKISQFPTLPKNQNFSLLPRFLSRKKIHLLEIIDFTRELSTLISTGISITNALTIIQNSHEKSCLKALVQTIKADIESGKLLGEALKRHPTYFSPFFIQLTLIGEQSGTLEMQLKQAGAHLEKILNTRNKLKKSLTYPTFVILFTFFIMSGILTFIVPQFQTLFQNFNSELPLLTRLILNLSHSLKYIIPIFLIFSTLCIPVFYKLKRTSSSFALLLDQLLLKCPLIGSILKQHLTARICNLLAVTYRSGICFPEAFLLLSESIENKVYSKALREIPRQIKKGTALHQAIENSHIFPKRVFQMIYIAEQSGALLIMLKKMGIFYENQTDHQLERINQLLEPIIIGILGLSIGILIIAMYLPIFRLGNLF